MKIAAFIPARYAASRFPGKLMQSLGGKPVIQCTYEATMATGLFDEVAVVTDSNEIHDAITAIGGKVLMSGKEHECGTDRIAEAAEHTDADIVVNVQGDEPFVRRKPLADLLDVFTGPDADLIDLASLMQPIYLLEEINNPHYVKVVVDTNNFALLFSRSPIPYYRNKDVKPYYFWHKGVYAFRKKALLEFSKTPPGILENIEKLEQLRHLENGKKIKMVVTDFMGPGIDTLEDLIRAREMLN